MGSICKPLKEENRLCGRVMTVQASAGDSKVVFQALRQAESGRVLIVDVKGEAGGSWAIS